MYSSPSEDVKNQCIILKTCKYRARIKDLTCPSYTTESQGHQIFFKKKLLFREVFWANKWRNIITLQTPTEILDLYMMMTDRQLISMCLLREVLRYHVWRLLKENLYMPQIRSPILECKSNTLFAGNAGQRTGYGWNDISGCKIRNVRVYWTNDSCSSVSKLKRGRGGGRRGL